MSGAASDSVNLISVRQVGQVRVGSVMVRALESGRESPMVLDTSIRRSRSGGLSPGHRWHRWERRSPCISPPAAGLQTLPATVLALLKQWSVGVMMAGATDDLEMKDGARARRQYSSASMTVITRTVTTGSVGSGERYFRFRSK